MRRVADLPGPRAWPLVGNLLQLKATRIHQDVERWCRLHGPLFRFTIGCTPVLVVADHKLVAAILRDRPDGFRRPAVTARVSEELGGAPGLFLAEGAEWRNQRRMVMAGFAPPAIKAYFPALLAVAQRLQRRWEEASRAERAIELTDDLKRYTVDIIAPDPAAFTIDQMDALDYLDACTQETMRLKPVAPFMPFEALRATTVGGVLVPQGAMVWCVLRHDSVDEAHVPNAARFAPERWLEEGALRRRVDRHAARQRSRRVDGVCDVAGRIALAQAPGPCMIGACARTPTSCTPPARARCHNARSSADRKYDPTPTSRRLQ